MSRHRADYQHYLASRTWARLRARTLRRARGHCMVCRAPVGVEVHQSRRRHGLASAEARRRAADRKRQMLLDFIEQAPAVSLRSIARIHQLPRETVRRLTHEPISGLGGSGANTPLSTPGDNPQHKSRDAQSKSRDRVASSGGSG